jgi:lanthanide-dependent methanol dehydrogenase
MGDPRADAARLSGAAVLLVALLTCSCSPEPREGAPTAAQPAPAPVAFTPPAQPIQDDGQWLMSGRNYASTRFSGLTEINTGNVRNLRLAWTFSTGYLRGQEATPIVVGDTMYIVSPFPHTLFALDLNQEGAIKWTYKPDFIRAAQGVACCDFVNRGAVYSNGRVIFNTLDNYTIAVDAASGKEIWKVRLGDYQMGETMTMAPLVVKDKVLVGNSGGEMGVRGWITALDVNSGKIVWRAYGTGPDSEVLIGPNFRPFYERDRGKDLGLTTWPPEAWRIGGATVWGWISYDPELNLIYYGTGNPGPWNPEQRPGDNKWSGTLFARNPDTGEAVWAYQFTPHDVYDYDGNNEDVLVDLTLNGQLRKVMLRAERNGLLYVIDRTTGEVLSADKFAYTNVVEGVDLRTGRAIETDKRKPGYGRTIRNICPAVPGAKDWEPTAYSPLTGYLYIPANNLCMDFEGVEANYIAGTPYMGANVVMHAGPGGHRGEFLAWDPVARQKVWGIKEKFPTWGGAVATAGDLVFYGTMDRWLRAVHARTGEVLWEHLLGRERSHDDVSRS